MLVGIFLTMTKIPEINNLSKEAFVFLRISGDSVHGCSGLVGLRFHGGRGGGERHAAEKTTHFIAVTKYRGRQEWHKVR